MYSNSIKHHEAFTKMSVSMDIFVNEVKKTNKNFMATEIWTVKEILCHIVFWHINYAQNYEALFLKKTPPLLEGPGYKLNIEGVKNLKRYSIDILIKKLNDAQDSLYKNIVIKEVPRMTYKKSTNRVYTTIDFLRVVERHLLTHTEHVQKAKKVNIKTCAKLSI
jgi:hypothetical protein